VNKKNCYVFVKSLLIVLSVELLVRILFFSNFTNIYGLKSSLIFPDTNFLGVFFVPIAIVLFKCSQSILLKLKVISILLLTASRTTWISFFTVMFVYNKSRYFRFLFLSFMVIFPPYIIYLLQDFLVTLDGSLSTKLDIFLPLLYLGDDTIYRLVFGFGKINADLFADAVMERNVYVGHTIYGNILQYGILSLIAYFYLISFFVFKGYRTIFLIYIFSAGVTGLMPYSYLPLSLIFTRAVLFHYE
jgi:hypothetical protein